MTHGHRLQNGKKSRTYLSWEAMRKRTCYPKHHRYPTYGGRGITCCDAWADFAQFLTDMGERPDGRTLDRVDPEGNYEPSNCRWATPYEQTHNRRKKVKP